MADFSEDRVPENESPAEKMQRLAKQNVRYKQRASKGWRHPKDRRGYGQRMLDKFKKGPFHIADLMKALRRDAGFPTIKAEWSFKEWLGAREHAQES